MPNKNTTHTRDILLAIQTDNCVHVLCHTTQPGDILLAIQTDNCVHVLCHTTQPGDILLAIQTDNCVHHAMPHYTARGYTTGYTD